MNRDRRSSSNDPTDEPAVDQSTQSASGLAGDGERPTNEARKDASRAAGPLETPRRYEQPIEDDDDPVMPSVDSTVNTKI